MYSVWEKVMLIAALVYMIVCLLMAVSIYKKALQLANERLAQVRDPLGATREHYSN